jgi:colicin import membrane protein
VQFAEPLFFKPGEQNISESDALQRLQAKAQAVVGAKDKVSAKAKRGRKAEEQARQKAKLHEEQMAMVKAEAAREIARIEAETAERIAKAKAEARAELREHEKVQRKNKKALRQSAKGGVVKKLDSLIKDRNRVY